MTTVCLHGPHLQDRRDDTVCLHAPHLACRWLRAAELTCDRAALLVAQVRLGGLSLQVTVLRC